MCVGLVSLLSVFSNRTVGCCVASRRSGLLVLIGYGTRSSDLTLIRRLAEEECRQAKDSMDNVDSYVTKLIMDGKEYFGGEVTPDGKSAISELSASPLSRITFSWLTPLMILGVKRPLESSDIGKVKRQFTAEVAGTTFQTAWSAEVCLPPSQFSCM